MKNRNSNFEILRIACMFLIVLHHFSVHGLWPEVFVEKCFLSTAILNVLATGGKLGVNLFVLITGYFMISRPFKTQSLTKVLYPLFFYAFALLGIFLLISPETVTSLGMGTALKTLLFPLMPWFGVVYIALYLFTPWINKFLLSLEKQDYLKLLFLAFCIFSLIPTLFQSTFVFSNLSWFVFLYATAGFIRLHGVSIKNRIYVAGFVSLVFIVLATIFIDYLGFTFNQALLDYSLAFQAAQSVPLFLLSLALFLAVEGLKVGSIDWVNAIAGTVFGIYLIHDNALVREWLWPNFSDIYYDNPLHIVLYAVMCSVLVFSACGLIEAGRQKISSRICVPWKKELHSVYAAIDKIFTLS